MDKRNIVLTPKQAAYVDDLVARGLFQTVEEAIDAGLASLHEREEEDLWFRLEVLPVLDAAEKAPDSLLSLSQVHRRLSQHHARRSKPRS